MNNLLVSFLWKINTGVKPDCEYVEVTFRNGNVISGHSSTFYWSLPGNWPPPKLCDSDTYASNYKYLERSIPSKYREITAEEWKKNMERLA